ncbi:MAG: preprotein translocase subunit SecG [Proteobacteria bacterium]|nr:preprotein translocase subunit SecG [Pseudomonadota bacterium]
MLVGLLTGLLIFVSLVLIVLIIALQHGNEGGIGSAFGGGNSAGFFGASGGVTLIVRATWIFGASFFFLSTALAWVKTHEKFGVTRELDSALTATPTPAAVASPAAPASPAASSATPAPLATGGAAPAVPAAPAAATQPAAPAAATQPAAPAAAAPAAPAAVPAAPSAAPAAPPASATP